MLKTKIKKAIAVVWIMAIASSSFAVTQIGTGSVVGDATFDSAINWDDTFGGTANASGSVTGIIVKAVVAPTLNMAISAKEIDLGILNPDGTVASGTLDLEIGTNAASGVKISVRSWSGWLTNISNNAIQINDLTTDDNAESYKFKSALNAAADSTVTGFISTAALNTEVDDNTTEHTVYETNKPEVTDGVNDVTFTVESAINYGTPAGNYQDTLTFTVLGNI